MSDCGKKKRVAMVGSGNFACAIVRNVGDNVRDNPDLFHPTVNMWTFQEEVAHPDTGQPANLTDVINSKHENIKYLPGVRLPDNIVAEPDMSKAVEGADVLVICMPHQFIAGACRAIRKGLDDRKVLAVSLVKGFHCDKETGEFQLVTKVIGDNLGVDCGCLMGANLADEIAK